MQGASVVEKLHLCFCMFGCDELGKCFQPPELFKFKHNSVGVYAYMYVSVCVI